ncbi:hypothetical protein SVIO_015230 [Streptomyces violaceusniger]|uniref:Uncharacterized protein n=1 Tax=Streptomyces violaceusniger TaxID=68280 RepID=A0A4D4KWF6_STRVO|nr:hypothetical protein SVIO_015230 [Streptomyces violaceusniger]
MAGGFCDGSDDAPAGIEALLKEAVRRLGERDLLGQAAAHTFGLLPDRRGAPAHDRRKVAAAVYGVTPSGSASTRNRRSSSSSPRPY